jgi:hypothetical protein
MESNLWICIFLGPLGIYIYLSNFNLLSFCDSQIGQCSAHEGHLPQVGTKYLIGLTTFISLNSTLLYYLLKGTANNKT